MRARALQLHRLFSTTSRSLFPVNSKKHLALQDEIGKTFEQLRANNTNLQALNELKHMLQCNEEDILCAPEVVALIKPEPTQHLTIPDLATQRFFIQKKLEYLNSDIRAECADKAPIHAAPAIKK